MAHTPGPWRWWTSNNFRRLTSEAGRGGPDGGVLRASICDDGVGDVIVSGADMALIAAAPDLLAACEDLVGLCTAAMMDANRDGAEYDIKAELSEARAAIAKAKTDE